MNICFIGNFEEKTVNGVSNAVFKLGRELVKQGNIVWFYSFGHNDSKTMDEYGIRHREYKGVYTKFAPLPSALSEVIKNNVDSIELYHLHSVFTHYNYQASKEISKNNIPYVITTHGGYLEIKISKNRLKKFFYTFFFEKKFLACASGVIAVADGEVLDIRKFGYRGRVAVIPNSVSSQSVTKKIEPKENMVSKIRLLYLGRYDINHKGLDILLNVFSEILKRNKNAVLTMYGGGKGTSKLKEMQSSLDLSPVSINDPIYGTEKHEAINSCSLYIQTSRWEVFGISVAEAMAQKKPVALSSQMYLSDMVARHDAGIILSTDPVEAAIQIIDLHEKPGMMAEMGEKGGALAKSEFSISSVAEKTLSFYQEITSRCRDIHIT